MLVVAEIVAVGDDDVVEKIDAHGLASPLEAAGEIVVLTAGLQVAAGVVVAGHQHGGVVEWNVMLVKSWLAIWCQAPV